MEIDAYAALGRATKFYVVGILFYLYGRSAEGMVKDVSIYIALIAVPVILLGIYLKRRYNRKKLEQQKQEQEQKDDGVEPTAAETSDQTPSA